MSKSELMEKIRESIGLQMRNADSYKSVNVHAYSAWCQRAQVLGWALAWVEKLDSLE